MQAEIEHRKAYCRSQHAAGTCMLVMPIVVAVTSLVARLMLGMPSLLQVVHLLLTTGLLTSPVALSGFWIRKKGLTLANFACTLASLYWFWGFVLPMQHFGMLVSGMPLPGFGLLLWLFPVYALLMLCHLLYLHVCRWLRHGF